MLPPWPWLPGCCSWAGLLRGCSSRPASTLHACRRGHCRQALCSACSCLQGKEPAKVTSSEEGGAAAMLRQQVKLCQYAASISHCTDRLKPQQGLGRLRAVRANSRRRFKLHASAKGTLLDCSLRSKGTGTSSTTPLAEAAALKPRSAGRHACTRSSCRGVPVHELGWLGTGMPCAASLPPLPLLTPDLQPCSSIPLQMMLLQH